MAEVLTYRDVAEVDFAAMENMEAVLANDEASTDEELLTMFVSTLNVRPLIAVAALTFRSQILACLIPVPGMLFTLLESLAHSLAEEQASEDLGFTAEKFDVNNWADD